jgi:hypothetical protein
MHRPPLKEWLAGWWIHPVINGRGWKIKWILECWVSKWTAMGIHECGGTIITSNMPMTCWFRWQNKVSSKNACRCVKHPIPQVLLLLCSATSYPPPAMAKMLKSFLHALSRYTILITIVTLFNSTSKIAFSTKVLAAPRIFKQIFDIMANWSLGFVKPRHAWQQKLHYYYDMRLFLQITSSNVISGWFDTTRQGGTKLSGKW